MAPDNDPKELPLEAAPETTPAQEMPSGPEKPAETSAQEATETAPPRRPLFRRLLETCGKPFLSLKGLLQSGVARIGGAGGRILQRLRNRFKTPREAGSDDERPDDKDRTPRAARKKAEPPPIAEAPKAVEPRSKVRSFFLYLLALIVGGIAGMTFSFALLSKIIANQAEKIVDQRDEIAGIEAQLSRTMQAETKYRLESMESKKKLNAAENQLNAAIHDSRENAMPEETTIKPTTPATTPATVKPGAAKPGKCVLEPGKIGDDLTRCIDIYNRR